MKKTIFRGGTVVSGGGKARLDILVEGGRIKELAARIEDDEALVADVEGKLIFPGFIDGHTHMDLEVSGTVTADGFETGTKAEAAGGTTCLIDFATQNRGESLSYARQRWLKKAEGKSSCDYAFHMAVSDWNDEVREELEKLVAEGISSFKLYMTYDAMVMDDQGIYEILVRLKELGGIAGVHCENRGIIEARLKEVLNRKRHRREVSDYPDTRPALAEAEAVNRLLAIAACAGAPVIIVHLSSREGLEEAERARSRGQKVYLETCPQYLVMDREKYSLPGGEGRNYMCAPPLRGKEDREALWSALKEGKIQTIATDHCSFTAAQKEAGAADFALTPCGMPGAEERPALIYHYGVGGGRISEEQMCLLLAENPARLYGLYPAKGVIAAGSDADLVVWNPDTEYVLAAASQQSAAGYCPMEGTRVRGRAEQVYIRGELVAAEGRIIRERWGRYIPSKPAPAGVQI